jgi:hypothetical protein
MHVMRAAAELEAAAGGDGGGIVGEATRSWRLLQQLVVFDLFVLAHHLVVAALLAVAARSACVLP